VLEFGERRLAGWSWGDGERSLWLVHGWSGSAAQLGAFVPTLVDAGFRVRAWDFPAHGESPGRRTNLVEMAGVLGAAAQRHGPPEAIVAHSLGAAATTIALARGLDAKSAVLVAPPADLETFGEGFARFLGLSPRVRRLFQERIEREIGFRWRDLAPERLAAGLGSVRSQVVHDVGDREVRIGQGRRLAAAWPGSELVVTDGLGHNRILRDPEVVARTRDFLLEAGVAAERELAI